MVPGDGKTEEKELNLNGGTEFSSLTYTNTDVSKLARSKEVSYRIKSGEWKDETAYYTEEIHVDKLNVEGYVPEDSQTSELRAETDEGDIYYTLTLRSLDFEGNTTYDSAKLDNLKIPILGNTFEITSISFDDSNNLESVQLAGSAATVTVQVGSTVDYEGYKVKVADIDTDSNPNKVYLQLLDDQGNVVADDIVQVNGSTDFDGKLEDEVSVESVFSGETQKFAKLGLKSNQITVSPSDPYEDFLGAKGWTLKVSGNNSEVTFKVEYDGDDNGDYLSLEYGLKEGEAITFPGSAGFGVVFAGLTAKPMKMVKFDGDKVSFIDADGIQRTAKLAFDKEVEDGSVTTVNNILGDKDMKIELSGDTLYYDADLTWESGENITSDQHVTLEANKAAVIGLDPDGDGDNEVLYLVQREGTTLHFLFAGHEVDDINTGSGGPDLDNENIDLSSVDVKVLPYEVALAYDDKNTASITDDTFYWYVHERLSGVTDSDVQIYPKTKEGKDYLFDKLDFEDKAVKINGHDAADYDDGTSSIPVNAMTPFVGSVVTVKDTDTVEIEVPTEARKAKMFVGVVPQTIETTGEMVASVGDKVEIGGTEVTIKSVSGAEPITYTEATPMKDWNPIIVYLDSTLPNTYDNIIVVGGYAVNTVAAQLAEKFPELKDVKEAGDWIVKKVSDNGKDYIVVFGYTAEDTGTAAQEFINWLRQNVVFPQTE